MNILIAPDKFKGSLTAGEVCEAIAAGLRAGRPGATIRLAPLADGGDGTLAILHKYLHLRPRKINSRDPLGRPLAVAYLENEDSAFIEVAAASGVVLLQPEERNPLNTSTYGTGLQLRDALERGKRKLFLLLGGSATNDLGLGIAEALGFEFYDNHSKLVRPGGGNLSLIKSIKSPVLNLWENAEITLLCDVDNPLYGPNGAARVYAAQKGATPPVIEELDRGARHVAQVLKKYTGVSVHGIAGGGAAGGIGSGLTALVGAKLTGGFEAISRLTGLEASIEWADLVISGEGQIDAQSLRGKVVGGVLDLCRKYQKNCCLFAGRSTLERQLFIGKKAVPTRTIMGVAPDEEAAITHASDYLTEMARESIPT